MKKESTMQGTIEGEGAEIFMPALVVASDDGHNSVRGIHCSVLSSRATDVLRYVDTWTVQGDEYIPGGNPRRIAPTDARDPGRNYIKDSVGLGWHRQ